MRVASYDTFRANVLADFDRRYANFTYDQEQKLLCVHLQHFEVLISSLISLQNEDCYYTFATSDTIGEKHLAQWKWLAMEREQLRKRRHECAYIIQRSYRRRRREKTRSKANFRIMWSIVYLKLLLMNRRKRQHRIVVYDLLEEMHELKSTSSFVRITYSDDVEISKRLPVPVMPFPLQNMMMNHMQPSHQNRQENVPSSATTSHSFELVITLFSARDLSGSISGLMSQNTTIVHIASEVRLHHESTNLTKLMSAWQPYTGDAVHWNETLHQGIDPSISDPQQLISDWNIQITLRAHVDSSLAKSARSSHVLGKVDVPLALLETSVAQNYAMCRWFPLEKTMPGQMVRGELRIGVSLLMRQINADGRSDGMMIPYTPHTPEQLRDRTYSHQIVRKAHPVKRDILPNEEMKSSSTRTNISQVPEPRTSRSNLREKNLPNTKYRPSTSPRKLTSIKNHRTKEPGTSTARKPRVEAFSPPSSPSSYSSDNNGKVLLTLSPSKSRKEGSTEPSDSVIPQTSDSLAKPQAFLKRKPYKVVFQKLDWSNISSKTDSNWGSTASGKHNNRLSSTATSNKIRTNSSGSDTMAITSGGESQETVSAAAMDPTIADRLIQLSMDMYECCKLTKQTSNLAQLKFQSERKKYVIHATASSDRKPSTSNKSIICSSEAYDQKESEHGNASALRSSESLSALWKQLMTDTRSEGYATMLQLLTAELNSLNPSFKHQSNSTIQ